jgi:hypothetical protein
MSKRRTAAWIAVGCILLIVFGAVGYKVAQYYKYNVWDTVPKNVDFSTVANNTQPYATSDQYQYLDPATNITHHITEDFNYVNGCVIFNIYNASLEHGIIVVTGMYQLDHNITNQEVTIITKNNATNALVPVGSIMSLACSGIYWRTITENNTDMTFIESDSGITKTGNISAGDPSYLSFLLLYALFMSSNNQTSIVPFIILWYFFYSPSSSYAGFDESSDTGDSYGGYSGNGGDEGFSGGDEGGFSGGDDGGDLHFAIAVT